MPLPLKQQKQQQAQQMQFTIQQSEQEAKRLVIEAKGIAEANRIKGESVTPTLVSWEFVQGIKNQSQRPVCTHWVRRRKCAI